MPGRLGRPCARAAGIVQRRTQPRHVGRPVAVVAHVLLAAPHQPYRAVRQSLLVQRFCDRQGLHGHFRLDAPSKCAAHVAVMQQHLFRLQTENVADVGLQALQVLRRNPHFASVTAIARRGPQRFHVGVSQNRRLVGRIQRPLGGCKHRLRIAGFNPGAAVLGRERTAQFFEDRFRAAGVAALPNHVCLLQRRRRRPEVFGHCRHRLIADGHDLGPGAARRLPGEALEARSAARRIEHGGMQGRFAAGGIGHERKRAHDFRSAVLARGMLADQPEFLRRLEPGLLRHRHARGFPGQLPVTQRAAIAPDLRLLGVTVRGRHAPFFGCSRHQHLAGSGAGPAKALVIPHYRHAVAGTLAAVQTRRVAVSARVERCVTHLDVVPGDLHFIGKHQRQAVQNALPHVAHRAQYRYRTLLVERYPGIERAARFAGQRHPQSKGGGGQQGAGGGQHLTAVQGKRRRGGGIRTPGG